MPENDGLVGYSKHLCRRHKILILQLQHLAAGKPAGADPAHDDHCDDQALDSPAQNDHDQHGDDQARDTIKDIHHTHHQSVHRPAIVADDAADDSPHEGVDQGRHKADGEGHPGPFPHADEHIPAQGVRTEPMSGGGTLVHGGHILLSHIIRAEDRNKNRQQDVKNDDD